MTKITSESIAALASETLRSNNSSKSAKAMAASVLSQANMPEKMTSPVTATQANKILQDGRMSKDTKSLAASALSQSGKRK